MKKHLCFFSIDIYSEFSQTLLGGIRDRCDRYGYDLFVVHGGMFYFPYQKTSLRRALYRIVPPERFDAFLVSAIFTHLVARRDEAPDFLKPFQARPLVTMAEKFPGIPAVRVDNTAGFRALVEDLVSDGAPHSYAVIAGAENSLDSMERLATLREVFHAHGMELAPENLINAEFDPLNATDALRVFLDERSLRFDTLVCFNDPMAIAAMAELKLRGYRIPRDIRVTGFDNLSMSLFADPPLSTVDYPVRGLGERSVDMVRSLLEGRRVPEELVLPTRYMPRISGGTATVAAALRPSEGFAAPGQGLARVLETLEETHLVGFTPPRRRWLKETMGIVVQRLQTTEEGVQDFIGFLAGILHGTRDNAWSLPLWSAAFDLLSRRLDLFPSSRLSRTRDLLVAARCYAEAADSRAVATQLHADEYQIRTHLQMGEDVASAFDLDQIPGILARYCRYFGIRTCFVATYTDKSMARARLVARIEDYEERDLGAFSDFDCRMILPSPLFEAYPSLSLETLNAREENIGYMLLNLAEHPGVLFNSLRQYIAAAVRGATLVRTINGYSAGLEQMVEERTARLHELYQTLKEEIGRREQMERELLKQQTLESLGLLAGGIAHDFNNILTAVTGNLSMLQLDDGDPADRHALYDGMMKAVENARSLTQQLLTFSRGGAPIRKAMPIVPLVTETVRFLLHGTAVKPVFDVTPEALNSEIDASQISQVINNLVVNALRAMPDGGTLTVSAALAEVPPEGTRGLAPGRYVRASIADTGCGIPADIIDRIFDPYFSTRPGIGLGLSTSLAIVRKHGGTITVGSEPGKGSVFDVYLPASESVDAVAPHERVPDAPGRLRLLVMDDEPDVRKVLSLFLAKGGHECDAASDGAEAVARYEKAFRDGTRYDVVVMDLTVPGGMGGREAMARILEIDPSARGIVSSGYSDIPVLAESRKYGFHAILQKPFTYGEFNQALNEALKN